MQPDSAEPKPLSYRSRLILAPFSELPRQRSLWNRLVGEAAGRRVVQSQAMLPIAVWVTVFGWLVAISGVVYALAAEARSAATIWLLVGLLVNVVAIVSAQIMSRRFATSAARILVPVIQPLDPTATLENLTTIFGRQPAYFAALARKYPDRFPPRD